MKNRDYSSSVPARYIPKKSSKVNKLENSQQTKGSEGKEFRELSDGFALKSEVKHCRSGVQNHRDFDEKLQHQNQIPNSNSLFNDVEQGILFSISPRNCVFALVYFSSSTLVFVYAQISSDLLHNFVESPELEDQFNHLSGAVADDELMEEPEEVSEELDVLQGSKTTHDVEKAAIELLAGRLELLQLHTPAVYMFAKSLT